ncbi:beta-lactam-binding protein with PASTA domain [Sagittula marina]|uniref:Beta-lactam-binding protein with PASTA domain n=2 Tax=Sagittula marina TaxID=943940 RepID=A0A7W6GQT9_9RHOB|nr:beta-lactam-binding protein with PASTA domain [Sagittula marina]
MLKRLFWAFVGAAFFAVTSVAAEDGSNAVDDSKRLPFYMPELRGVTIEDAQEILSGSGQKIAIVGLVYSVYGKGLVAEQSPPPGHVFTQPHEVMIQLKRSKGIAPGYAIVPDVEGMLARDAEAALRKKGFSPRQDQDPPQYSYERSGAECDYNRRYVYVTSTTPPSGSMIKLQSVVLLSLRAETIIPSPDCRPHVRRPGDTGLGVPVDVD